MRFFITLLNEPRVIWAEKTQPKREPSRLTGHGTGTMSKSQKEEAAVERVMAGDTTAFAAIVERWQGPLINLAYRFCRDHERAEDMAQEAFIRAFRGLGSWRREAAFSTWLFALATNVYRDEMRRFTPESVPMDEDVSAVKSAEAVASEADRHSLVHKAVLSLPPKYRDPLLLYYFHEQDISATAQSIDLPEGTVKARLSRGRVFLGSKLGQQL